MYLREVILGSDDGASLYEETNVSEIAHAMRIVGKRMERLSLSRDASSEVSNGQKEGYALYRKGANR